VTLAINLQPDRTVSVGITLAITTVVSGSIAYLLSEFALRPVAALVLSDDLRRGTSFLGVGRRQQIFWLLGTGMPVIGLMVEAVLVLTGEPITKVQFAVLTLAVGGVVLAFGGAVNALNARSVVAPISSVRRALLAVERGDLDQRVPVFDGTELGLLQAGFNQMTAGLREREHIRDLFGRHVGQEVAAAAAAGNVELGGESRHVTVLFVDLVSSTGLATQKTPTEVVALLNRFFDVVVDAIDDHGGLVNKFMGDAVLGIFGAPTPLDDHPGRALAAARAIARRMATEMPDVRAGIGVYTGETVAGNVGTRERFEYTVIGDAVNAASRLTELAKTVDPMLLTSWETVEAAGLEESARWHKHDSVTLRGRSVETQLATCAKL
jgi:adenylate cyclase